MAFLSMTEEKTYAALMAKLLIEADRVLNLSDAEIAKMLGIDLRSLW